MFKVNSFQVLRAIYENPFFAYSRLCLGIRIFLQNRVLYLEWWDLRLNLFHFMVYFMKPPSLKALGFMRPLNLEALGKFPPTPLSAKLDTRKEYLEGS